MVASKARRSAWTRAAGTFGGRKNGRPYSSRASISRSAARCPRSWRRSRNIGTSGSSGILRERPLRQHADLLLRDPAGIDRLERRPVGDGAVHLAALHREVDLRRALVAGDDLELEAEQRDWRARGNRTGSSPAPAPPITVSLVRASSSDLRRRGVPDIHHLRLAVRAAEPVELFRIEAGAAGLQQRRGRHAVERRADDRAVERAVVVERVGHGEAAGAGLVLHDDGRLARNMRGPCGAPAGAH